MHGRRNRGEVGGGAIAPHQYFVNKKSKSLQITTVNFGNYRYTNAQNCILLKC